MTLTMTAGSGQRLYSILATVNLQRQVVIDVRTVSLMRLSLDLFLKV